MGFGHENLQCYPPTLAPSNPPFSALDRFLSGQTHFLQFQAQTNTNNSQIESGFGEFDGDQDQYHGSPNSWLLPDLQGDHPHDYTTYCYYDHSFHECNSISSTTHEMTSHGSNNSQNHPENGASFGAKTSIRGRRGSCSTLVKRKWSEEEDRTLMKLVKEYGMKKWACVAQKLDRRTAKQCRERWQNHLRPDIKKDSWSEEEEKVFVEAHKKLGNRWSEIARRIPGRTENAVKNHWNAAKRRRRQDRVSKQKKGSETLPKPPSFLQDYIIRSNLYGDATANINIIPSQENEDEAEGNKTTPISEVSTLTPPLEYEYEHSSSLINEPASGEELGFMLSLFKGAHHQPLGLLPPPPPLFSLHNTALSYGGLGCNEDPRATNGCEIGMMGHQQRKDIDLIELVSSSLY